MIHNRGKFAAGVALAVLLGLPAWAAGGDRAGAEAANRGPAGIVVAEKVMPDVPAPTVGEDAPPESGEVAPETPGMEAPVTEEPAVEPPLTEEPAVEPPAVEADLPIPTVEYDVSKLPPPARRIREQIVEAASSGDIEKLRPVIEANGEPPQFSFNDVEEPIAFLKSLSGDPEGREILAILIEVLDAGYVHVDVGTPEEMFVWPYFARYPVEKLSPQQLVELFKLIYAGDYEDMKADGNYLFYRVGITPGGVWKYFVAGD